MAAKGAPKSGGRTVGTPNKATAEIKDLARVHGPAAIDRLAELAFGNPVEEAIAVKKLRKMLEDGAKVTDISRFARAAFTSQTAVAVPAIKELLDRGYGKAAQPLTGESGGAIETRDVTMPELARRIAFIFGQVVEPATVPRLTVEHEPLDKAN